MIVIVMDFNSPKCQNMNNNDKEMKVIMNKTNKAITSMRFCWPTPSAIKLNASKNNNKKKLDRWSNKMKNVEFKVNLGFRKMSHKKELLTMAKTLIMLQTKKKVNTLSNWLRILIRILFYVHNVMFDFSTNT